MKVLGIIPSRLESSRVKQKPLHKIFGIPLIIHVLKRASLSKSLSDLIVATDSKQILDLVKKNGFKAILTSSKHNNGTERIAEVANKFPQYDYYTLINGDEILLNPSSINISINTLNNNKHAIASILAIKFLRTNSTSDFKIVLNKLGEVMYISRNDIPSSSRNEVDFMLKAYHIMTFNLQGLNTYLKLKPSRLEKIEGHEHLRLIENNFIIQCEIVNDLCLSLDTAEDIPIIEKYLKNDSTYLSYKI